MVRGHLQQARMLVLAVPNGVAGLVKALSAVMARAEPVAHVRGHSLSHSPTRRRLSPGAAESSVGALEELLPMHLRGHRRAERERRHGREQRGRKREQCWLNDARNRTRDRRKGVCLS